MRLICILAACWAVLTAAPLAAQSQPAPPPEASAALALFEAYQSGYLQLAALSCFQLYSSTGVIVGDFDRGSIDRGLAMEALEHNLLLYSACQSTLEAVTACTPQQDQAALAELARLKRILDAEGVLFKVLQEYFGEQGEENTKAAEAALAALEKELDQYTKPATPGAG